MTPEELIVQQAAGNTWLVVMVLVLLGGLGLVYLRWFQPARATAATARAAAAAASGTSPAPAAPAPAPPPSKKVWNTTGFWVVLLALVIGGVIYLLYRQGTLEGATSAWSTSTGYVTAAVLFILAFFVPKKPWAWARHLIRFLALVVFLATFLLSDAGGRLLREIERGDDCIGNQDCSPRAGDYPVINGGTVNFAPGESKTFYVEGTVALTNFHSCYYLGIAPEGTFRISSETDYRVNYITAYSGVRELAVVTSRRNPRC